MSETFLGSKKCTAVAVYILTPERLLLCILNFDRSTWHVLQDLIEMANIADPDKTAPIGAVLFGPAIFAGVWMPQMLGSFCIYSKQH